MIVIKWMDGSLSVTENWSKIYRAWSAMNGAGYPEYQYCYCCINEEQAEEDSKLKLQSVWVVNETPGRRRRV
jgi:hypothetical protein